LQRHRGHGILRRDVVADRTEETVTLRLGLGDVLLRLAEARRRERNGPGHLDCGEGLDWLGHRAERRSGEGWGGGSRGCGSRSACQLYSRERFRKVESMEGK